MRARGWSEPGRCGLNAVYCFLRVSGVEVSYDELASRLPIDPERGSSIEDLERVAEESGLDADVFLVDPADIGALETPFILHLELLDLGGSGHFVTVLQIDEESGGSRLVRFFDGGTARVTHQDLQQLAPLATGYVLLGPGDGKGNTGAWAILVGLAVGLPSAAIVFIVTVRGIPWESKE
jgi:ABC-type bacteriocin/lantibiotic exporter with double-glycine peptidase domain